MFVYYENIFQSIAFLCGLAAFKVIKPYYLKWLVPLLGITVLNEVVVVPYITRNFSASRDLAYNIFSLLDMGIWLYIFFEVHKGRNIQKWIIPGGAVIYIYTFIEIYFKGWAVLHTDSFRLYEIVILLLSCSYLYGVFRKEYHKLVTDPLFWISAACISYHSVLFLLFTTLAEHSYWYFRGADEVFNYLQVIGNIFYYLFLSFAFVACITFKSK